MIEGYHSTIFAYGQTGSGKTYTMEGYTYKKQKHSGNVKPIIDLNSPKIGLIPRVINSMFEMISGHTKLYQKQFVVNCSFLQIYNERIYDLLNPDSGNSAKMGGIGLKIRWNSQEQFKVENLFVFECKSAAEVLGLFNIGIKNKIIASHRLNIASSRSHTILCIQIESFERKNPNKKVISKL